MDAFIMPQDDGIRMTDIAMQSTEGEQEEPRVFNPSSSVKSEYFDIVNGPLNEREDGFKELITQINSDLKFSLIPREISSYESPFAVPQSYKVNQSVDKATIKQLSWNLLWTNSVKEAWILLYLGADPSGDVDGITPFWKQASKIENNGILKAMMAFGADPMAKNSNASNMLCVVKNLKDVKVLVRRNPELLDQKYNIDMDFITHAIEDGNMDNAELNYDLTKEREPG